MVLISVMFPENPDADTYPNVGVLTWTHCVHFENVFYEKPNA